MEYYAVIDTNVLVSGILTKKNDAATVQVIKNLFLGKIIPVYSYAIMAEYREVLKRKKFGFPEDLIEYVFSAIEKYGVFLNPKSLNVSLPDPKDLPFYETLLSNKSSTTYLITGNIKHFPEDPYIVTPRDFLNILNSKVAQKNSF